MATDLELPSRDELSKLPLSGVVAFAIRTARRIYFPIHVPWKDTDFREELEISSYLSGPFPIEHRPIDPDQVWTGPLNMLRGHRVYSNNPVLLALQFAWDARINLEDSKVSKEDRPGFVAHAAERAVIAATQVAPEIAPLVQADANLLRRTHRIDEPNQSSIVGWLRGVFGPLLPALGSAITEDAGRTATSQAYVPPTAQVLSRYSPWVMVEFAVRAARRIDYFQDLFSELRTVEAMRALWLAEKLARNAPGTRSSILSVPRAINLPRLLGDEERELFQYLAGAALSSFTAAAEVVAGRPPLSHATTAVSATIEASRRVDRLVARSGYDGSHGSHETAVAKGISYDLSLLSQLDPDRGDIDLTHNGPLGPLWRVATDPSSAERLMELNKRFGVTGRKAGEPSLPEAQRRVHQLLRQIFGTEEAVQPWLDSPNPALGWKRPADLLNEEHGPAALEIYLKAYQQGGFG
ncbi:MAG: DUF2384 domain-containing protein [Planctomycetia bacterium]|nr:DUF2384 domain-containing protein [Planctomycetia bacterium]